VQEALRRELERASLDLEHFEKEQVQRPAARARARPPLRWSRRARLRAAMAKHLSRRAER
jgi:hypothetical protein